MVARFYGPVQFGQFTTAHTLAVVFTLFADFGFDLLLTTEIGRDRQSVSYITPRMLGLKIVLTLVASLLMCAYPLVQTFSRETQVLIYIFSMYLFFSALQNFAFAFFRGHDELHHESQITLIINVALLVTLLIIALTGGSVYQVLWGLHLPLQSLLT
jgi:O-antigen/teichoic acid export membrane protein